MGMLGKSSLARGKCLPCARSRHYFCGTISQERAPGWQVGSGSGPESQPGKPMQLEEAEGSSCRNLRKMGELWVSEVGRDLTV